MKFLQGLALTLGIILGVGATVCVVGGVLYLTVPPVQEWMDETIFNKSEVENPPEDNNGGNTEEGGEDNGENTEEGGEEEVTDPETMLTARINFNNKSIILEV